MWVKPGVGFGMCGQHDAVARDDRRNQRRRLFGRRARLDQRTGLDRRFQKRFQNQGAAQFLGQRQDRYGPKPDTPVVLGEG